MRAIEISMGRSFVSIWTILILAFSAGAKAEQSKTQLSANEVPKVACAEFQSKLQDKIEELGHKVAYPAWGEPTPGIDPKTRNMAMKGVVGVIGTIHCWDGNVAWVDFFTDLDTVPSLSDKNFPVADRRLQELAKDTLCVLDSMACSNAIERSRGRAFKLLLESIKRGDPEPSESDQIGVAGGKVTIDYQLGEVTEYGKTITVETDIDVQSESVSIYAEWHDVESGLLK